MSTVVMHEIDQIEELLLNDQELAKQLIDGLGYEEYFENAYSQLLTLTNNQNIYDLYKRDNIRIVGIDFNSIPQCLYKLRNLKTLDISQSNFTEIPNGLYNLKNTRRAITIKKFTYIKYAWKPFV
jgi:Leucine-rich repeat (LRR) protein